MRRASALVLAAFLLAAGTACGIRSEPRGVSVPLYPVTVQGAGDSPIVLRKAPQRIVAVAVAPAQILVALGVGLAYLRARTDSLYPCFIVHALFNAIALTLAVTT